MDIDEAIKVTRERTLQQSSALSVLERLPLTVEVATVEGGDVWIRAKGVDEIKGSVAAITSLRWCFTRVNLIQDKVLMRFKHPDLNGNEIGLMIEAVDAEKLLLSGLTYA
jgi:hypothetical protein